MRGDLIVCSLNIVCLLQHLQPVYQQISFSVYNVWILFTSSIYMMTEEIN